MKLPNLTAPIAALARTNPVLTGVLGVTALAAPAFLSDDSRGYFKTALVTTPLVAAMGIAGPKLLGSVADTARSGWGSLRRATSLISNSKFPTDYREMREFLEKGQITLDPAMRDVMAYMTGEWINKAEPLTVPFGRRARDAFQTFVGMTRKDKWEEKQWLLTNAVRQSELAGKTTEELMVQGKPIATDTLLSRQELSGRIKAQLRAGNERFLDALEGRLRRAGFLNDLGPLGEAPEAPTLSRFIDPKPPLDLEKLTAALGEERGERMYRALAAAKDSGHYTDARMVYINQLSSEMASSPKLVGISLQGGQAGGLTIPVFDPATGTVHVGSNYRVAAGRRIWGPKPGGGVEVNDLDIWMAENLHRPADVRSALEKVPMGGVDPLNQYKWENQLQSRTANLAPWQLRELSKAAVPDPGQVFNNKYYRDLAFEERVPYLKYIFGEGRLGSPTGSEGSLTQGVFAFLERERASTLGFASWERQSEASRAFLKPMLLETVPENLRPYVRNAYMDVSAHQVQETLGLLNPQEVALFGGLPAQVEALDQPEVVDKAVAAIMKDTGRSREEALEIYNKLLPGLSEAGQLEAARLAGGLGETEFLFKPSRVGVEGATSPSGFSDVRSVMRRHVEIDSSLHIPSEGGLFGPGRVVGTYEGEEIFTEAPWTRVKPAGVTETGTQIVNFEELYPSASGRKVNIAGVKGLTIEDVTVAQGDGLHSLINRYRELTGKAPLADNVTVFANALFFTPKEPTNLLLNQGADLMNRVMGTTNDPVLQDALGQYESALAQEKIIREGNDLVVHTELLEKLMSPEMSRLRQANVYEATKTFAERVAGALRDPATARAVSWDPVFRGFLKSGQGDLLQYMSSNALSISVGVWSDVRVDKPGAPSVTMDLFGELYRSGMHETLRDIKSRAHWRHGSPAQTAQFIEQMASGSFTQGFGTVVPYAAAAPSGLGTGGLGGRVGVLNYTDPKYKNPFSVELPQAMEIATRDGGWQKVQYLYHPGWGASGGGPNMEGPGIAHFTDFEKAFTDVVKAGQDPQRFATAFENYQKASAQMAWGKEGNVFRARGSDPFGVSGFAMMAETGSPWEVQVSKDALSSIRDQKLREALLSEGGANAIITRHPLQSSVGVRVRAVDSSLLGSKVIGIHNQLQMILGADFDKDTLNLHLARRGSEAEKEIGQAITNTKSYQHKALDYLNMMWGNAEDISLHASAPSLNWAEAIEKEGAALGNVDTVLARQSATLIPRFSNMVTESQLMLGSHPALMSRPDDVAFLQSLLYMPRQGAISSVKGEAAVSRAEEVLAMMKGGLQSGTTTGAENYLSGLKEIAAGWKWDPILTERTAESLEYTHADLAAKLGMSQERYQQVIRNQEQVKLATALVESPKARRTITELVQHPHGQEVRNMTRLLVGASENLNLSAFDLSRRVGPAGIEVQSLVGKGGQGTREWVSHILGAMNAETRAASKSVKAAFKPAAGILAAGLGVAALAGLMTTTLHPPSAARYRPETGVGTTDRVPGEPVAGVASAAPPRRELPPRSQTRTTVVAPVHQSVDLEVRAPSRDRERSAELRKVVSQIGAGGGNSSVTVNYLGGQRHLSRLRTREKVRDILDRS